MAKLHELLSVESDLRGQAEACRTDKVESQLALQTTVRKELAWIGEKLAKALNIGHQIDVSNTTATADVVLDDGTILLRSVPTTSLLRLEHRVVEIRELVHTIGTVDPAKGFEADPNEGEGIFRARDVSTYRGEKVFDFVVMVPPTDKHPAQVKELVKDVPTTTVLTQEWSSLVTVAEKGDMLDRVEDLLRAIKQARARANEMEIDVRQNKIGESVLNYVFNGTK